MTGHVAILSTVDKDPLCVSEFLESLDTLDEPGNGVRWLFSLPSDAPKALANLLEGFCATHKGAEVVLGAGRDDLLAGALAGGAGSVFVAEPTLVLPPRLLAHLVSLDVDIVAEVFWTRWQEGGSYFPNVWACDQYSFCDVAELSRPPETQAGAAAGFLSRLHDPGTVRVGGLSACTLISRQAIEAGARFNRLPNVSMWDEERHFCIRAVALGFTLWADTHYPPLHLYRRADLAMVDHFRARWAGSARTGSECEPVGAAR